MKRITTTAAKRLIKGTKGSIFTVSFKKVNGSIRTMNCRLGVTKGLKGVGMAYNPKEYGLLPVFDLQKNDYRMIRLNSLLGITVKGQSFRVVRGKI